MPDKLTPIAEAQAILKMDPLPDDAEAQFDALYVKSDEFEKMEFGDLYEVLFMAENA